MRFVALVLLLLTLCGAQAATPPDLVLQGELRGEDMHTYKRVPIKVPAGVSRITINVEYTGKQQHTVVDLGLLGPDGHLVGWSGGNKKLITVSAVDATPSYIPTPTVEGEWNLLLGIPNIRPRSVDTYTAQVWFSHGLAASDEPEILRQPLRREPGWYRGDLHMHTAQSDGSCPSMSGASVPCPVFVTVQAAVARKLDFIAVTDHNTSSHFNELRELQPYFDHLLLMPGREVTTFYGHANLFGTMAPLNFRVARKGDHADWNDLLDEITRLGGVFSVNHPRSPTGEICMGCGWGNDADLSKMQAIEAVNGADADSLLFSGVPFWQDQLQKGLRPTAIGGSDNHEGGGGNKHPVGMPTTVVHAEELSQLAILQGIRLGHVFVDTDGTPDRLLEFTAQLDAAHAMMGDALVAPAGKAVRFDVHVAHAAGAAIHLIQDAREVAPLRDARVDGEDATRNFTWTSDGKRHWIRVEVRDASGHLMLLGNPIYLNPQLPLH
ncbi:MAG: CehA/McbA family metallohydrolase [Telluria sp.]